MNTITIITIAAVGIICPYAIYLIHLYKEKITNLIGIALSAAIAAMTGLLASYIIAVLSQDLFLACGVGIIIGFTTGFLAGQPVGIMPILLGSSAGFVSGSVGSVLGISIKAENPYILMLILLIFFVILVSLAILYIRVLGNEKLTLDTRTISPLAILSAGVVLLSLFLFLYSSDAINGNNTAANSQSQSSDTSRNVAAASNDKNSTSDKVIALDVSKESTPIIKMEVTPTGYSPNLIKVKKGVKVELDIHNPLENSCLATFNMPDFNINNVNLKTGTTNLTFMPANSGVYTFSCGMDMFKGTIIVE